MLLAKPYQYGRLSEWETTGFRREVDENCTVLGYYAAFMIIITDVMGQPDGTIFKGQESKNYWPFKMGPIGCTKKSLRSYHYTLRNGPEERSSRSLNDFGCCNFWLAMIHLPSMDVCRARSFYEGNIDGVSRTSSCFATCLSILTHRLSPANIIFLQLIGTEFPHERLWNSFGHQCS